MSQAAIESKYFRALWLAWQLPELDSHQATLEKTDNSLVKQAFETIKGGNQALARAVTDNDVALLSVLDRVYSYPPPQAYLSILQKNTKASLPGEIWPDHEPVMVAEVGNPFGEFGEMALHECKTWFETYGARLRPKGTRLVRTDNHWRKFKMKNGRHYLYCPGCYEKRVRRIINQVVDEAMRYPAYRQPLTISHIDKETAKKAIGRWKGRGEEYAYKMLPQWDGQVVLIHNQPDDLKGDPIPTTRKELFDLFYNNEWCRTPEGRRIDGSKHFGGNFAGSKGDGRKRGGNNNMDDEELPDEQIRIRGKNYDSHLAILRGAGFVHEKAYKKGRAIFNKDITWGQYIEALELGGVKWECIEGMELLEDILKEEGYDHDLGTRTARGKNLVPKSQEETAKLVKSVAPRPLLREMFDD